MIILSCCLRCGAADLHFYMLHQEITGSLLRMHLPQTLRNNIDVISQLVRRIYSAPPHNYYSDRALIWRLYYATINSCSYLYEYSQITRPHIYESDKNIMNLSYIVIHTSSSELIKTSSHLDYETN